MEDVILEVLERVVGGLRSLQVRLVVFEEEIAPAGAIATTKVTQSIHRQFVVRARASGRNDNAIEKGHAMEFLLELSRSKPNCSTKGGTK